MEMFLFTYNVPAFGCRMQCCKDGVISAILTAISHYTQLSANVVSKSFSFLSRKKNTH